MTPKHSIFHEFEIDNWIQQTATEVLSALIILTRIQEDFISKNTFKTIDSLIKKLKHLKNKSVLSRWSTENLI